MSPTSATPSFICYRFDGCRGNANQWRPRDYDKDGLNSVRYEVVSSVRKVNEYAHLLVKLLPAVKQTSADSVNVKFVQTSVDSANYRLSRQSGNHIKDNNRLNRNFIANNSAKYRKVSLCDVSHDYRPNFFLKCILSRVRTFISIHSHSY